MDLAEIRTALYNSLENMETKTGEAVTETSKRDSERAKVAYLESCLRESSGTEAKMT